MNADIQEAVIETAKTLNQPTVSQIVGILVKEKNIKFTDATNAVYIEWKKGTINLAETNPTTTLTGYFFSLENTWFWATTGLMMFSALIIFTVQDSLFLTLRYILGGIFIFLPGFLLISAMYPTKEGIEGLERIGLSIGVGLALIPIIALLLNYTPWGITLEPIVASIAVLTEVLAVVCVVRKFRYHVVDVESVL